MLRVFNGIQDHVLHHPLLTYSIAITTIILFSGVIVYAIERFLLLTAGLVQWSQQSGNRSVVVLDIRHFFVQHLQSSKWDLLDHVARTFLIIREKTREITPHFSALADRLEAAARHHLEHPWIARIPVLQTLTALALAVILLLIRRLSGSWVSRYRAATAHALHFVAFASFVGQGLSSGDWLASTLVMVSFDVFQRALEGDACDNSESRQQDDAPSSAAETLLEQTHSVLVESQIVDLPRRSLSKSRKGDPTSIIGSRDSKDRDIVRLQWTLTDLQTANKAKDLELLVAQQELLNARDALTKSFADISALHNDMKIMKQTLGKNHQAIVYRKDIELFALRKGNEQKERLMQERDAQLDESFRQQHATLELKEAQLNVLKERLAMMERQTSPKFSHDARFEDNGNGDHALEVRLLRIKKGRRSLSSADEEKDAIIERLQHELAAASRSADDVVNQQAELKRAWDISKKIQHALIEERERHDQTKACLIEASAELEDTQSNRKRSRSDPSGRLPTIEEHDQNELEAMFDTAQQDNLRLHVETQALDKRLREANSRVFAAEEEIEALREQVRLEHAINEDMEAARPSVVHRVHFQRLEGQLKESKEDLTKRDTEIQKLKTSLAEKDRQLEAVRANLQTAMNNNQSVQKEIAQLKQSVLNLEAAKESLIHEHEQTAAQRSRPRVSSAEFNSARTSGATLINEHSPPRLTRSPDDALPVATAPMLGSPVLGSGQDRDTSRRHIRKKSDTQRHSMVSNAEPSAELGHVKRKSGLGLRDMVKRIVKKDSSIDGVLRSPTIPESLWGDAPTPANDPAPRPVQRERPLSLQVDLPAPKKENAPVPRPIPRPISGPQNMTSRPRTSTAPSSSNHGQFPTRKELDEQHLIRPRTASVPNVARQTAALPKTMRPTNSRQSSQSRYYASPPAVAIESTEEPESAAARPHSATAPVAAAKAMEKQRKHDSGIGSILEGDKSKLSRLSWGNTANKLKRRSLY